MNTLPQFSIRTADWTRDQDALRALRHAVFVVEQGVPDALEWDGLDPECQHVLAVDAEGAIIGCGRLLPDGHIGRMAVAPAWRCQGAGAAMLRQLMTLARAGGHARVALNAQTRAMTFYAREGFLPVGPRFMEAGIEHQAMERPLE